MRASGGDAGRFLERKLGKELARILVALVVAQDFSLLRS